MPNPENRTGRDFSMYDTMNDEQLRQILRDDASKLEGEDTDMELMLHIMEVLAKRRKEAAQEIPPEEALERFNEIYKHTDNSLISEEKPAKPKRTFNRWQRWVATVAAVLVLVFCSSLTAQAFGFDIFEVIVRWTKETFHFASAGQPDQGNEPSPETEHPYASLREALSKYKIETKLIPSWIPSGYSESDVKTQETPKKRLFIANYVRGDDSMRIRIADYLDDVPLEIEQSGSLIEVFTTNSISYYIFDNNGILQAAWTNGNFECYISGPLSVEEMKEIIESIEKG